MNDKKVLRFAPFDGDFGSPGDKVLKDKMGTARKAGQCSDCSQQIQPGERVRLLSARFDGELRSYRWCALCCEAMALAEDDGGKAHTARLALRRTTAEA